MIEIPKIKRPNKEIVKKLKEIGSANASGTLYRMGITNPFIQGPTSYTPGKSVAGPAITLQFLPKRADVYDDDEYSDPELQLHRHALYQTEPGDVVVVDAMGDMTSGVFGEMMLTFFQGRGGVGVVLDGCIRDYVHAQDLEIGMWLKGVTPNFHTQTNKYPHAVNVPIACGGTLVVPGDIIVADDDGAVVVPQSMAEELAKAAGSHHDWEIFVRQKLAAGGHLRDYYGRRVWTKETDDEYKAWCRENNIKYVSLEEEEGK
ncbi:MAG: ribonuclease activity regulator RraA [Chloroflexota bacterium]|tara:strand:- start:12 stop:791 length:780 start_codon:yes stop_codon:yes gene_type:complete